MYRKISFLLLLSLFTNIHAQKNTISSYMNDGGRSKATTIIKTDIAEFCRANIPVIWEHRFSNFMGIQAGAGLLTNSFLKPLYTPKYSVAVESMNENLKSGFSLFLSPIFYTNGFESFHFGFPIRYRNYPGKAVSYEFNCTFGKQWFVSRRVAVELDLGLGFGYETSKNNLDYIYDPDIVKDFKTGGEGFRLVVPFSFRIGYVL